MPLLLPPRPPQPSPSLVNDSTKDSSNGNIQVNNAPESSSISKKRALDDAAEPAPQPKRRKVYEKRTPKSKAASPAPETQTATAAPVSKTATLIPETQIPPPSAPSLKPSTKKKNRLDLLGYTEEELAAAQQMLFEQSKEIHALQPQPLPTSHEPTNNPPSLPSTKRKLDECTGPSNQKRHVMSNDPPVLSHNALGGSDGLKSSSTPQIPAAAHTVTFTPTAPKKSPAKARKSPVKDRKSPAKKATQLDIHPPNRYPSVLQPSQAGQQTASPANQYLPAVQHGQMGQQTTSPVNQYLSNVQHGHMGQQNCTPSNYTVSPSQNFPGHGPAGVYTTDGYNNSPYASTPYGYNPAQQHQQQASIDSYAIPKSNTHFSYGQTRPTQQFNGNTAGSDIMGGYHNSPYANPYANTPYIYSPAQQQQANVGSYAVPGSNTQTNHGQPSSSQVQLQDFSDPSNEFDISQFDVGDLDFGKFDDPLDFGGLDVPTGLDMPLDMGRLDGQYEVADQQPLSQPDNGNLTEQAFPNQTQLHAGDFNTKPSPRQTQLQQPSTTSSGTQYGELAKQQQSFAKPGALYTQPSPSLTQAHQPPAVPSGSYYGKLAKQQYSGTGVNLAGQSPPSQISAFQQPKVQSNTLLNDSTRARQEWLLARGSTSASPKTAGNISLPKSGMTPTLPSNPQYAQRGASHTHSSNAGMAHMLPAKPQNLQQNVNNNPPSKTTMTPMLLQKTPQIPSNAGNYSVSKSGMTPAFPTTSQNYQTAGNGPSLRPNVTPMHPNKPQHQQSAGQTLPPKFGMADVLPNYSDYRQELQRLRYNITNNNFPKSSVAAPNAGNNPQPDFTTKPASPASPHYSQQGMGNNLPTKSSMTPMPSPRARGVGQNSGHNPPAKSGMKPLLPPKPQDVPQRAGTNPPLKSCMKPLLPPKPQDVPHKAGTNPPLKTGMKPLLPPKPQDNPQRAGTNPPLKTGMKPLLPPKAQPTAQKAGSTPPPKNSMTPTLPGSVKGTQGSMYYPAQAPQYNDASAGRTYYPPGLSANTDRSISGTRLTQIPQPPTPSSGFTTAHHKALGINYANAPRMGPNMQQVLGHMPNNPVAGRSNTITPSSCSYNTPAAVYAPVPAPKKAVPYTTAHAERASYRGGALMYEVPPSSVTARGYGGSAAVGSAGSLRPLEFVAQDPPPGYGPTATTGYMHEQRTVPPTQAQAEQQQQQQQQHQHQHQQTASVVKPVIQRDAFPYFFETLMAEGSVASVTSERS